MELDFDMQLKRTIAIIRRMGEGEHVVLPSGYRIGMGVDMSIGFMHGSDEEWSVSGLSTLDIKELNEILNKNEIYFPIPKPPSEGF